ncbi:DUF742 domain-containing protein [Pseudonocardia humida]|uniref:DUF742 domain-containing protein n=1 Tax=Pseudonocardia humida TaxID=2800819 RepID=A0ABT1A6T5_9PSEU|nr:DUF742 domain-containing protein [Pseudonocardia humida]MCO1658719.1 DUF742 domain-containing protein [Pseudonocardia humida]
MNPEESADMFGGGASGTERPGRRGPTIGSDGAVTPSGGTTGGPLLPAQGFGTDLPAVPGTSWAWDGGVLPASMPALPEQRADSSPAGLPEDEESRLGAGPTSVVRPYVRTGGRTRSSLDLSLETLVSVLPKDVPYQLPLDEHAVLEICREQSRSVAEVAALHRIPIGVAKVIIGDLAAAGLLAVHRSFAATGPDLALMERVLGGLRRI